MQLVLILFVSLLKDPLDSRVVNNVEHPWLQVTEATTSPTATPTGGGGRGLSLGAIIGIAVGLGSLLLITAAVLLCACRRRRLGYTSYNNNDPAQYATSSPAYVPQHQAYQYK